MAITNGSASGNLFSTSPFFNHFIGSTGNDNYFGNSSPSAFNLLNYSSLGQRVTLLPQGVIRKGFSSGTDTIQNIDAIIGANGQDNKIDGDGGSTTTFNINLNSNSLQIQGIPGIGTANILVVNFVDVDGTRNNDIIIGNGADNELFGDAGNDRLEGGAGDDRLIGDRQNSEQFGNDTLIGGAGDDLLDGANLEDSSEVDILTGGTGADIFSFQDDGDVYQGLTVITDFNFFEGDRISLPGFGSNAFGNFSFQDGVFRGQTGAFLNRNTVSNGGRIGFFETNAAGGAFNAASLNAIFSGPSSPIV